MKIESRIWNSALVLASVTDLEDSHRSGSQADSDLDPNSRACIHCDMAPAWLCTETGTEEGNKLSLVFLALSPCLISIHCLHLQHIWKSGILQEYNKSGN